MWGMRKDIFNKYAKNTWVRLKPDSVSRMLNVYHKFHVASQTNSLIHFMDLAGWLLAG